MPALLGLAALALIVLAVRSRGETFLAPLPPAPRDPGELPRVSRADFERQRSADDRRTLEDAACEGESCERQDAEAELIAEVVPFHR